MDYTDLYKYKNADQARKGCVRYYVGRCIITGLSNSDGYTVVGGHIFPASTYPDLKSYRENIIAILFSLHTGSDDTLDWIKYNLQQRKPVDRLYWLESLGVRTELRSLYKNQVYDLMILLKGKKRMAELDLIKKYYVKNLRLSW